MSAAKTMLWLCAMWKVTVLAAPYRRSPYSYIQSLPNGDSMFQVGNLSYIASVMNPKAVATVSGFSPSLNSTSTLVTVVQTNASLVTQNVISSVIADYLDADDVLTEDFLQTVIISSSAPNATLDSSASTAFGTYGVDNVFLSGVKYNGTGIQSTSTVFQGPPPPPGPYLATFKNGAVELASVYLLYADSYRDFLFGVYDSNDGSGTYTSVPSFLPRFWDPMIPVPSRLYSLGDGRPLAGERVAIKDLFDIKGLQTSGGSQAWAYVTPLANGTAPAVQKIIDLGGVIVGKYKLAQFASGADPWQWQDEHYPFNPRGDGWLTCSASSSGGGCSVAAYDWLDYAIGSDTGSSMRRPAAVSGTYG